MGILLAFAPFVAFALINSLLGVAPALIAGAIVSAALLVRGLATLGKSPKILDIGTVILFAGLAFYAFLGTPSWSIFEVRLLLDAGLLLIVLTSIVVQQPFTLQYARERVAREYWMRPEFIRTNYIITGAWALAFMVLVAADLTMVYATDVPRQVGVIATVIALAGAFKFTSWYPEHLRATAS